jgi:outer membrane protein, multidrug efflux system
VKRILLLSLMAGCTVGPNYKQPDTTVPDEWKTSSDVITQAAPIGEWWKLFEDPLLDKYIEMGAASNYDLLAIEASVLQARALRMVAAAPLFPQLFGDINATHSYFSKNGPIFAIGLGSGSTTGGGGSTTTGTVTPTTSGASSAITGLPFSIQIPQQQNLYNILLDAAWEIDFFGGTRRSIEAAEATIGTTLAQRDDLLITLLAEIASTYMELRAAQKGATLVEEKILYLEEMAAIIRQNREEGLENQLQLESIQADLAMGKAALPNLIAEVYRGIYALSVLTGQLPEALAEELLPLQPLPKPQSMVAVGLRSDLIRRRPDVRVAERQLANATANIGVATAAFFPTFTLLGDVGLQSLLFPKLFQANSRTWAVGGDLSIPIFQGGSLVGNLRATQAAEKAAVYKYQQIVLKACQDAESAVAAYQADLKQSDFLTETVERNHKIVALTEERYDRGLIGSLPLLQSQLQLNQTEQNLLQIEETTLLDLIALYKSLGGGWSLSLN